MHHFASPAAFAETQGQTIGPSAWVKIDQAMIDRFADATGDHQWIHVDPARAAREAPGGTTIAHGYLTLSLLGKLMPQILEVQASRILNVGANRLRFLAPVPVDSRLRLAVTVLGSEPASGGLRVTCEARFEVDGAERPALIAEIIFLYFD